MTFRSCRFCCLLPFFPPRLPCPSPAPNSLGSPSYLFFGQIFIALRLLHTKLVVHLLPALADVFALAEVIDVCEPLLGLPLGLSQNILDLRVVLGTEQTEWGQLGMLPCLPTTPQQPFPQARACLPLTESTSNLEQKKQTQRKTFMVLTRKPTWNTGLASSMWPKWPGHSVMFPVGKHRRHVPSSTHLREQISVLLPSTPVLYEVKPLPPSRVHASPPPLTRTGLAAARPLNHPLPRIHQPPKLGAASLGRLWVFDAAFCHRHSLLWKRKANTELNPSDFMAGELYTEVSKDPKLLTKELSRFSLE